MSITEKVARAICDNVLANQNRVPSMATAAITAFLEAVAEKGWRLVRVEPTEAMRKAGMEEAPLNYYEDGPSSRRRISMDTDEVGPVFRAMCDATPKYEVEE